ncbi:ribosomal RNA small subunit methyltransferase I [Thermacetogenium phaeum DSM 12270]|uniref:Ribosomal RNA small subunit methyltransferase I n=2 Tax=Thermacetogenium phaeum TaxID=85874 RepID=K4LJ62_THEPS|nr:ribosomal RNA small subunit methyltransferase I [Thermacetogenium phaeum DSM 12270]
MGELYLCATPLGNLEDITLRALRVLAEVDLIAAEDTRHTRKLLAHYKIATPTTSYHEHNEREKLPFLLSELSRGKSVALVSDAGTPAISDPGSLLVRRALEEGHRVTVVPGASAVISALVVSGMPAYPFYFYGFLPRKRGERRELLQELEGNAWTGVFYEAPHRLRETLTDFVEVWGEGRRVAVVRELTKQFEEVYRGSFAEAREHYMRQEPRGEITLVVEGKRGEGTGLPRQNAAEIREAVAALMAAGADLHDACKAVGRALKIGKSEVYRAFHD